MRLSTMLLGASLAAITCGPAFAQDVVMRRPIPKEATATIGDPSTPTPTPTIPSTPDENDVIEDHPDPTVNTCDHGPSSPGAILVEARWIETGWKTLPSEPGASCTTQQMGYACQATYSCQVDGENLTFTDLAPTSLCPNVEQTPGGCPPGYHYPPSEEGAQCVPDDGPIVLIPVS